jgi:hypothetical protein
MATTGEAGQTRESDREVETANVEINIVLMCNWVRSGQTPFSLSFTAPSLSNK